jgi:transposase
VSANILNLPQYRVASVEEDEHDYHIYAETLKPQLRCVCGSLSVSAWGAHEQLVKDLPIHAKRVGIYVRTRRFRCDECNKTGFERLPAVSNKRAMTDRLVRWIGQQSLKRTFSGIAEETGVDEKTVRNIFRDYVNELEQQVRIELPRWLGIDEIHILQPRCVVANIEARTIVNILRDRNKRTVAGYLHSLSGRERVKYVAMDMWNPYRDAVATVLPQATVVIDKFHVVRMANVAMEQVRKSLRGRLTPKQRRGLMHDRFLLLKRERELTAQERFLVDSWSTQHPDLGEAYRLKEQFFAIYHADGKAAARSHYERWSASIPPTLKGAFSPITTAWRSWSEPILAYFDHPVTNAYTESLNNLIEVIRNREANIRSERQGPRRGYSFDAIRAAIVCDPRLHRVVDGVNYGVDMDKLIAELGGHRRRRNGAGNGVAHGVDDSVEILSERRRA